MQADWQSFLSQRGAVFEAAVVQRFDAPASAPRPSGVSLFDLSQQGLLSVGGDDADNFLQGQLTSDIHRLAHDTTHLTSYCTPQGRMLAIMRAFRYRDTVQLLLPQELLEPVQARLLRYVLRAQVTIGSDGAELGRIAIAGEQADALLAQLALPQPLTPEAAMCDDALCVMNVSGTQPCFILVAPYTRIMQVWQSAEQHAQPVGEAAWRRLQIDAGVPTVYTATSEAFVPQMCNLELLGGVDFNKGCYTGQEIVARAQYLGRIKRRMFLFRTAGEIPLQPGDAIVQEDGAEVGMVVDAAFAQSDWHLLGVVRIDAVTQKLYHGNARGSALERIALPYDVPSPG